MKITRREHFGIQRKMVSYMTTESWKNIPHTTYMYEPDVTEIYKVYKKINENRTPETKITFNTLMLRVVCEGLKACPIMNSHVEFNSRFVTGKIDSFEDINISMPTILPNGEMMTINLRNFGNRSLENMTEYIKDVRRRAEKTNLTQAMYEVSYDTTINTLKQGHFLKVLMKLYGANFGKCKIHHLRGKAKKEYDKIPETERLCIKDLQQGTIVVSNVGSTYLQQQGALSLLEVVPPMATAIGIGAIQEKAAVVEENGKKEIAIRSVLPICIAFDHRVLDFGDIVPFMRHLDGIFANPEVCFDWVTTDESQPIPPESGRKTTSYGVVTG